MPCRSANPPLAEGVGIEPTSRLRVTWFRVRSLAARPTFRRHSTTVAVRDHGTHPMFRCPTPAAPVGGRATARVRATGWDSAQVTETDWGVAPDWAMGRATAIAGAPR